MPLSLFPLFFLWDRYWVKQKNTQFKVFLGVQEGIGRERYILVHKFFFFSLFCFFFFLGLDSFWGLWISFEGDGFVMLLLINSTVYLSGNRDFKFRRESKLAFSNPIIIGLCFFFLIFWFSGLGGDLIWVISLFLIWVLLILMIEEVMGHFEISHLSFSFSLCVSLA